jgi:hypothetical protein
MRQGVSTLVAALATLGAVAAASIWPPAASGGSVPRMSDAARMGTQRAGTVQHPIEVRIRPLDPIRRGASVRFEVRATAHAAIANAEVRLVSPGGVSVDGARRLPLGRLEPRREAAGTFRVTVPDEGRRFLVQFVVSGEGPAGPLARGAVYNLLPDGPLDPGRLVTATGGARIHEFAATRSGR